VSWGFFTFRDDSIDEISTEDVAKYVNEAKLDEQTDISQVPPTFLGVPAVSRAARWEVIIMLVYMRIQCEFDRILDTC
jgi:hypothetical protein